ncbi:hypothetical protein F67_I3_11_008 [Rhizobium phage RHph_I3_11]|nr:hypothetical protein F67_I3_11_008 [Rhizobium phage RHph_I3_11]
MEKTIDRYSCRDCTKPLYSNMEIEERLCNRCTDKLIQHANERAEWHYYHS